VLQVIVDMIPKYYKTPRSLPVIGLDGKRAYRIINDPNSEESVSIEYDPSMLQIKVEASVNTAVEKQASLELIARMSAASEVFGQFINTKGLPVILDNLEIRGIDQLKALSEEFLEEQAQAAEAQSQEPTPVEVEAQVLLQIEQMKNEMKQMQLEGQMAIKSAELAIQEQKTEIEMLKALAEIESKEVNNAIAQEKAVAENTKSAVEMLKDITESIAKPRDN